MSEKTTGPAAGPSKEPLSADQFTHHGTDFRIIRLDPMLAHQVMEYLRPALFEAQLTGVNRGLASLFGNPQVLDMIDPGEAMPRDMASTISGLADVILTLPPPVVERLRTDLFSFTMFRGKGMSDYEKLYGNESDAFDQMPRGVIYNLIIRGFIVNFFDLLPELGSLLPGIGSLQAKTGSQ